MRIGFGFRIPSMFCVQVVGEFRPGILLAKIGSDSRPFFVFCDFFSPFCVVQALFYSLRIGLEFVELWQKSCTGLG